MPRILEYTTGASSLEDDLEEINHLIAEDLKTEKERSSWQVCTGRYVLAGNTRLAKRTLFSRKLDLLLHLIKQKPKTAKI